jgi:hypothetical protein
MSGWVLVFGEYGLLPPRGEKDAVDEFFADKLKSPITLMTGQAIVIKLPLVNGERWNGREHA